MKTVRWAVLLFLVTTLVSVAPVQSSAQSKFSDVTNEMEFYNEVNYIADKGIIQGYPNGTFKPNNEINRFQAAKMLVISTGNKNHIVKNMTFTDIKSGTEYYDYLSKAVDLGYFKKNSDGSIKAFEKINRAEMGYALAVAFNLSENVTVDRPLQMDDLKNHPDVAKLNGLYYAGIAQGSKGNFNPNDLLKRRQFAQFVARALNPDYALPVKLPEQTSATFFAKVDTGSATLNIRSQPSSNDSSIIGKLYHGDIIEVVGTTGEWLHIIVNNSTGYIHGGHTIKVDADDVPPVEEQPDEVPDETPIEEEQPDEAPVEEEQPVELPSNSNLIGKVTATSLATCKATSFSFILLLDAPGSLPPCPASMTIIRF